MNSPIVLHLSSGPSSTEFARFTGIIQREAPQTQVSFGTLTMDSVLPLTEYLYTTVPYWPEGAIFFSNIHGPHDPGNKEWIAVKLNNQSIVFSPNNGTASLVIKHMGFQEVRRMDLSSCGEDEYAPVRLAARLAKGLPFEEAGPLLPPEEFTILSLPKATISQGKAEGVVTILLKTFGNLTFSIGIDEFEKTGIQNQDPVRVTFTKEGQIVYQEEMTYQKSFGFVEEGAPLIFNGSSGYLDIGLNKRSFIDECLPSLLTDDPLAYQVLIEKI